MHVRPGTGGFSLVEVAVAVAVLALGCLASAGVFQVTLHAEAASQQRRESARLLDAEAARLAALPFFRQASGPGEGPPSLLGDVFPHARRELNRPPAVFGDASGAAVFVSVAAVEGRCVRRTATLVSDDEAGATPVPESEVQGWAVWDGARPPALAIDISLELVDDRDGTGVRSLRLRAVRPVPALTVAGRALLPPPYLAKAAS